MPFELRDGQGTLFKNAKREPDSNQPNAKGEANIGGVIFEVAAWTKKDKNGNPWQSLSFKPKGEGARRVSREPKQPSTDSTEIPF